MFWGEYPLTVEDIPSLPSFMINGETYGPAFDGAFRKQGIRQMISTQGEERIFPDYFPVPSDRRLHPARNTGRRAQEVFDKISFDPARGISDIERVFVAGWADAGQHPKNFWLGYAVGTAAAWHPGSPDVRESMAAFIACSMDPTSATWIGLISFSAIKLSSGRIVGRPSIPSRASPSGETRSGSTSHRGRHTDQSLTLPPVPGERLSHDSSWKDQNARRLQLAEEFLAGNDEAS